VDRFARARRIENHALDFGAAQINSPQVLHRCLIGSAATHSIHRHRHDDDASLGHQLPEDRDTLSNVSPLFSTAMISAP
jgi:hypothetical protein